MTLASANDLRAESGRPAGRMQTMASATCNRGHGMRSSQIRRSDVPKVSTKGFTCCHSSFFSPPHTWLRRAGRFDSLLRTIHAIITRRTNKIVFTKATQ